MVGLAQLLACSGTFFPAGPPHVFPGGYERLSETGLFSDLETRVVDLELVPFTPTWVLWSDGAVKRRWVFLPADATLDSTDPDRWRFPVGTRFFKEFASPDGRPLETRLVERIAATGEPARDFWMGAFAWRSDGSDADQETRGSTTC